jgi:hypothetical protein
MEQFITLPIVTEFKEDAYEEDELVQKVFPVAEKRLPNTNRPPATGEEYLRMVRLEANERPNVVIAKNPIIKPKEVRIASWVKRGWAEAEHDSTSDNLVNEEWRNLFLTNFILIKQVCLSFVFKAI